MKPEKTIFLTEEEKLRAHLSLSDTERFRIFMRLLKLGRKMKQAKIIEP